MWAVLHHFPNISSALAYIFFDAAVALYKFVYVFGLDERRLYNSDVSVPFSNCIYQYILHQKIVNYVLYTASCVANKGVILLVCRNDRYLDLRDGTRLGNATDVFFAVPFLVDRRSGLHYLFVLADAAMHSKV